MTSLKQRIAAVEKGRVTIPGAIRAWLGDPVTADELAWHDANTARGSSAAFPPDLQRWLIERRANSDGAPA